jgi:hypothetical protein
MREHRRKRKLFILPKRSKENKQRSTRTTRIKPKNGDIRGLKSTKRNASASKKSPLKQADHLAEDAL